jgi:hypothetical protein
MLNKIIDGISIKINELFGEDYFIYSEDIKQGLNEPCFFISSLINVSTSKNSNRSFRTNGFNVQYFPRSSNEKNTEINNVIETLMDGLEYISVDDSLIRGSKMKSEVVDCVLHFFINYDLFVKKENTFGDAMESMTIKEISNR